MLNKELQLLIDERKDSLQQLVISTADAGLRYLFTMNGGAIIAVLAFIGSANERVNVDVDLLTIALTIFFASILLVGFVNLRRFHLFNKMWWTVRASEIALCQIAQERDRAESDAEHAKFDEKFNSTLKKAFQKDKLLGQKSEFLKWIAYFSFLLFGIGGGFTAWAFF